MLLIGAVLKWNNMEAKISLEEYANKINISIADLKGESRKKKFSLPRQVYWYYLLKNGVPLGIISKQFNRKHSTILYGIKNIKGFIEVGDKTINQYLEIFSH